MASLCALTAPSPAHSQTVEILSVGGSDPVFHTEAGAPPEVQVVLRGPSPRLGTSVLLIVFQGRRDLPPGEINEYILQITGLRGGGPYSGRIELRATGGRSPFLVLRLDATNTGWVDVDPPALLLALTVGEAATRGITLESRHTADTEFQWSSGDLIDRSDSTVWIDRHQISLQTADDKTLEPGQPKNFTVSVASAPRAGTYEGQVALARSGGLKIVRIPIRVEAREPPSFTIVEDPLNLTKGL